MKALVQTLTDFSSITDDSRHVIAGALFVAYPGLTVDGRDFIGDAVAKGAAGVVFENKDGFQPEKISETVKWFPISRLQDSVGMIAATFYDHPSQHFPVVAVTGTNGKTSCAQFVAQALTVLGKRCGVLGTIGNGVWPSLTASTHTTPSSIALQGELQRFYKNKVQCVSLEASSHALAQGRLAGTAIHTAIFTNITRDHLDYHHTMANYEKAKAGLFEWPELGASVINADDPFSSQLLKDTTAKNVYVYGLVEKPGYSHFAFARAIHKTEQGIEIEVVTHLGARKLKVPLWGSFNASNVLAVLCALLSLGFALDDVINALTQLTPVSGRMELIQKPGKPLVIVDYAHTPDALEQLLKTAREHCNGRLICVFGCGGDRDAGKRPLMGAVAEHYSDHVVITNDNPRTENPSLIIEDIRAGMKDDTHVSAIFHREAAIASAIRSALPEDCVVLAGKGHEDYQIIGQDKRFCDDRVIARTCLEDSTYDEAS